MKILFLDCPTGISGDMLVAALLDLGVDYGQWEKGLRSLPLDSFAVDKKVVYKNGLRGLKVDFVIEEDQPHRGMQDIVDIIQGANLSRMVTEKSLEVFSLLAKAEAFLHGTTPEEVHFHEVGAVDSLLDIVGTFLCLEQLQIERISFSPLPYSRGFVKCAHGTLPVPAPATLEILRHSPLIPSPFEGELITPTGAALAVILAEQFGAMPPMTVDAIGYGAGSKDLPAPNVLRAIKGDAYTVPCETKTGEKPQKQGGHFSSAVLFEEDFYASIEPVAVLETTIDDISQEIIGYVLERLRDTGVLDVFVTPVQMKKNRPGNLLTVLTRAVDAQKAADIIFRETSTLGIRLQLQDRLFLSRSAVEVPTAFGLLPVKIAKHPQTGEIINAAPEYSACRDAALTHGVPLKQVYQEVYARLQK